MPTTTKSAKGSNITARSGIAPYTQKSDDTQFNIRRKSSIYQKKIKNLVEMYKGYAGVHGKLDAVRKASLHFMADTMSFENERRMPKGN
jgi:hypothetical protein